MTEADQLLLELDEERNKFSNADDAKMQSLCDRLVELGVYPSVSKINLSPVQMAEGYGANWHTFRPPLECPHCHGDLRNHEHGPPFKREIAMILRDRCVETRCPDCKGIVEDYSTPDSRLDHVG